MEIYKTTTEKSAEAGTESTAILEQITEKLKSADKVKVRLGREDFKDELSTSYGYGFQDLKKKNKIVITELIKMDFNIKFEPDFENFDEFGVLLTIKKK